MVNEPTDLDRMEELFAFLQGDVPDGIKISGDSIPRLSADQAWTVCWYLGNLHWKPSDEIERCDVCGCLYDSGYEGGHADKGPPYHFCEECNADRSEGGDMSEWPEDLRVREFPK